MQMGRDGLKLFGWLKRKVKPLSLEELKQELKITEEQINIGMAIAKANPNHPQMWESVWFRVDEANRLRGLIKQLEETE